MITMDIGLFAFTILIFFLGGGAIGWLLRGLRKHNCECGTIGNVALADAIRDAIRKDLAARD